MLVKFYHRRYPIHGGTQFYPLFHRQNYSHPCFVSRQTSEDTGAPNRPDTPVLDVLRPATEAEIRRLIMAAPNKSCELDKLPTPLVKTCIDILLTPVTSLINKSLEEGSVPPVFKNVCVSPLLKKTFFVQGRHEKLQASIESQFHFKSSRKGCCLQNSGPHSRNKCIQSFPVSLQEVPLN